MCCRIGNLFSRICPLPKCATYFSRLWLQLLCQHQRTTDPRASYAFNYICDLCSELGAGAAIPRPSNQRKISCVTVSGASSISQCPFPSNVTTVNLSSSTLEVSNTADGQVLSPVPQMKMTGRLR